MPLLSTFTASFHKGGKLVVAFLATAILLVVFTLLQDYVRANLHQTGYYFSESFLFSSFWWLFAPLWFGQYMCIQLISRQSAIVKKSGVFLWIGVAIVPIGLHLLLFPSLVWVISAIFFDHTFGFGRNFTYTLSEHLYLLLSLYFLPVLYARFAWVKNKRLSSDNIEEDLVEKTSTPNCYPETLWVDAGNGTKKALPVSALTYCTANSPYVNLNIGEKKYLHTSSLKALGEQLDPNRFIRIHKTTLVNIEYVSSVKSRQNGDYDITLKNSEVLRVSRHYAANFKARMEVFSLGLG